MRRYIDRENLLLVYKDPKLVNTLVTEFLKQTTDDASVLADVLVDGVSYANKHTTNEYVHKLKGAAGAVGALTIVAYCEAVETALTDEIWIVADYNLGLLMEDVLTYLKLSQL